MNDRFMKFSCYQAKRQFLDSFRFVRRSSPQSRTARARSRSKDFLRSGFRVDGGSLSGRQSVSEWTDGLIVWTASCPTAARFLMQRGQNLFHLNTVTVVVVRKIKVLALTANQLRSVNQFQ